MKKIGKAFALGLLVTMLTVGCGDPKSTEKQAVLTKVDEINISYVKLPLNVPSIVEKKVGLFEKEFGKDNIKVTFPEIIQGPKMTEAMAAGALDFANALGGTSAILAAANGVPLKVIGIYSRAPKAFTIMAKDPAITSVADLKDKKVAGPKGTILHQLLLAAQEKSGLKADEVSFINMDIPPAMTAMLNGNVEAALIAGPAVSKAQEAGAHVITTGEDLLSATIVIAVRTEFLDKHPDLVKRYLKVHADSMQYMKEHTDDVYKMAAEETGLSLEQVENMYTLYDFNPVITDNDIKDLEKTQDFLKQNGMLTKTVDIRSMIATVE
ncbi:MAG TPA: NrtA/SsuA/CpmA family ABC transporter substrate-binding protein [Negativicutes bacterium]|jgi:sulfonate transport system substrate-binding protein